MEAVKETINNQATKPMATQVIILTLSNFVFDGINYLQKKGCAMCTICALAYGNIFLGKFEKLHIYPYLKTPTPTVEIFLHFAVDF